MDILLSGITSVFTIQVLLLIMLGVVAGIIIGAIPGLTVTMGVALFLPITYTMEPIAALSLIMGLYIGGTSGGLISAILLNIPGTPSSIATTFDGHPLAKRGEAGKALGVGIVYSFIGGLISFGVLMLLAPTVARVALQFGPYEYFAIGMFSLTMIASLSSGSLLKGLLSAVLGMMVSFIGLAPVSGYARFTAGSVNMSSGIALLPLLIGLFAIPQILIFAEEKFIKEDTNVRKCKIKGFGFTRKDVKGQAGNTLMSAAIGTGIGILPGLGGGICNIIAYSTAKSRSKHPETFGQGEIGGIIASETSNNASIGGALIPLLTLGIPGDNTTAIILAGFMIHGITPGPLLFKTQGQLIYGIFAALIIANFFMLFAEFAGMRIFIKVLTIPKRILLPIVTVFCVVGAFGVNNRIFDVFVMLVFGILGYGFKKLKIPEAPLILGFILGPIIELNLRRGLMKSEGSLIPFFTKPIAGVILIITIIVLVMTIIKEIKKFKLNKAVLERG